MMKQEILFHKEALISSRCSITHFSPQGATSKLSLFDKSYATIVKPRATTIERPNNFSVRASSNSSGNGVQISISSESEKGHGSNLQILDYPYQSNSKLLVNHFPSPSTPGQLLNLASKGSRFRVAYQGVRGAYSQSATEKVYPNYETVQCEQFDNAFEAVEKGLVDRTVLPFENSLGGSIHRNYDLLFRHKLHIVGEVKLAIRHCLLANHGVQVEDLKRVLSHPQALAQCENTLTRLGLVREARDNTAGAAKFVASNELKDVGVVASMTAARLYGLNVLARDIQDESDNITRFLILARKPITPRTGDKPFKTSIVFLLKDGPGMLFKPLAIFASQYINVTKIEARPLQKKTLRELDYSVNGSSKEFPYLFYVDFEASVADQKAQNALGHLKEFVTFLRVLGSYAADTSMP